MKNIVGKLIISIALLTVSATLVGMFSYAWLTMSGAPEVDGIQINIGGGNTIMVAPDITEVNEDGTVSHYPGEFSQKIDFSKYSTYDYLNTLAGLTPVSCADGINWVRPTYYSEDSEEAKSGEVLVGQLKDIEDFEVDTTLQYANLSADELKSSMTGNYVYIDFWVVSPGDNYDLRISTGSDDENSGSFVIGRMEAEKAEGDEGRFGYTFSMKNEALSSAVRVGFLVSNDWCTYTDNLKYAASTEYDSRYTFLKGQYVDKGSNAQNTYENSNFIIYEPNGDLHYEEKYDTGYYKITEPIGVVDGVNKKVNISDRLTVQMKNSWKVGANNSGTMIEQLFFTGIAYKDLNGKTPEMLTNSFYNDQLQNVIAPYVNRGWFIKDTEFLYEAASKKGYVFSESPSFSNVGGATQSAVITTLEKNVPQRIRMFIWLEGQDEDCVNYGEISSFIVNLELAGSNDR